MAPADRVTDTVAPPLPPPPPDESRNHRSTLRSTMKMPPVDGSIVAPAAEISRPSPPATQLSSPTLLSTPVNTDGDGYLSVAATRGHCMTPSAMVGRHPASVGIQANTTNAFEALSAVSSGISTDPQGDTSPTPPLTDTIGIIAPMAYTSLQALLDNSYEALFGTDPTSMTEGSPIRFKELFDNGARVIDRLMSDIQVDQECHQSQLDRQIQDIRTKKMDMQSLANVEGSLREAIERLKHETAGALGPTLLALPALTEVATANAKAINELTAATKANATAIQELGTQLGVVRHDLVACAVLKPIVDDIRYSQLLKIWDNIKKVETKSSADFSTVNDDVHRLESKFMDGLDMVNTRVDELLRAQKSPPQPSHDVAMPPMASKDTPPIQPPPPSPHIGGTSTSTKVLPDYVNPDERRPSSGEDDAGTSCSSDTLHQAGSRQDTNSRHPRFRDAAESGGTGARMEPRSHAREPADTG